MTFIKDMVRNLMLEILKEPEVKIEFAKNSEKILSTKKQSIYTIIEYQEITGYRFDYEAIDTMIGATKKMRVCSSTLSEFRHKLSKLKSVHDVYSECTFVVTYNHPLGQQTSFDFIERNNFSGEQLINIRNTLVDWIDKHPELLL